MIWAYDKSQRGNGNPQSLSFRFFLIQCILCRCQRLYLPYDSVYVTSSQYRPTTSNKRLYVVMQPQESREMSKTHHSTATQPTKYFPPLYQLRFACSLKVRFRQGFFLYVPEFPPCSPSQNKNCALKRQCLFPHNDHKMQCHSKINPTSYYHFSLSNINWCGIILYTCLQGLTFTVPSAIAVRVLCKSKRVRRERWSEELRNEYIEDIWTCQW